LRLVAWAADPRMIAALLISLAIFAVVNNVLTYPREFHERMTTWTSQTGATIYNADYIGQLDLALRSLAGICSEMGWPLLLVAILGIGYGVSRFPKRTLFLALPLAAFLRDRQSPRFTSCSRATSCPVAGALRPRRKKAWRT